MPFTDLQEHLTEIFDLDGESRNAITADTLERRRAWAQSRPRTPPTPAQRQRYAARYRETHKLDIQRRNAEYRAAHPNAQRIYYSTNLERLTAAREMKRYARAVKFLTVYGVMRRELPPSAFDATTVSGHRRRTQQASREWHAAYWATNAKRIALHRQTQRAKKRLQQIERFIVMAHFLGMSKFGHPPSEDDPPFGTTLRTQIRENVRD